MSEENKALIRRFAEEVVERGDVALIAELFSEAYVVHDPANPMRAGGIEGARRFVEMFHAGLSGVRYALEDMIAEGDRVVYRWTLRGTHSGVFMGVPATSSALEIKGVDIFRIEGGKIVESWVFVDALGLLQQLGLLPPPPGAPPPPEPMSAPASNTPVSAVPPTKRN